MSRQQSLLEVIEVREDARVRVRLWGEFDLAGAPTVTECLRSLPSRGRETVLVDLDELEFIDMSGLRALLLAAEDAAGEGLRSTVTRGSDAVRRLLSLVGVDEHLPVDGCSA